MKSKPSAQNREGIRLKVLWPLALLMVLVFMAAMLAKSHSGNRTNPPGTETIAAGNSNVLTAPHETAAHRRPASPASQAETEPETARLAALLFDGTSPPKARLQSARLLASIRSELALIALKSALTNDLPLYVKVAVVEGLGQFSDPEARDLLHELVNGKDETLARGAARGLGARGDADAVNALGHLLFNDQTPLSVRTEAALALGDVTLPTAQDLLTRAVAQIHDDDVLESALDGLGRRPFSDTQDFFRNYLNSPDVPTDAKVLAIEAVRDADGDVTPFLSNYLTDANPEVRAAAKDALDFLDPTPAKPSASAK